MNSNTLVQTHIVVVTLFLLIYLIKTILIFANQNALVRFNKIVKVPEMIISTLFLITGIWLFAILGAIKVLQIVKIILVLVSIPLAVVAYKKLNKGLALISFLFILGAYGLAEMGKGKAYIPKAVVVEGNASDEFNMGAKIYGANCSMCHGLDGRKQYRDAKDLSASDLHPSLAGLIIREGSKGKMPTFKDILTDDEVNAAVKYIQTLKK